MHRFKSDGQHTFRSIKCYSHNHSTLRRKLWASSMRTSPRKITDDNAYYNTLNTRSTAYDARCWMCVGGVEERSQPPLQCVTLNYARKVCTCWRTLYIYCVVIISSACPLVRKRYISYIVMRFDWKHFQTIRNNDWWWAYIYIYCCVIFRSSIGFIGYPIIYYFISLLRTYALGKKKHCPYVPGILNWTNTI